MAIDDAKNGFSSMPKKHNTGKLKMGRKIKELRMIQGLRQRDLGEKVGISHQQIQKYESGANSVPIDNLCAIAEALSVDVSVLLSTVLVHNRVQNMDSNCLSDNNSENEKLLLDIVKGFKKIKSRDQRKAVHFLVKSLTMYKD